jgi:hypothetical protein
VQQFGVSAALKRSLEPEDTEDSGAKHGKGFAFAQASTNYTNITKLLFLVTVQNIIVFSLLENILAWEIDLKEKCHEIVDYRFFFMNHLPPSALIIPLAISNFWEIFEDIRAQGDHQWPLENRKRFFSYVDKKLLGNSYHC